MVRGSCAGYAPCLPANYPDCCVELSRIGAQNADSGWMVKRGQALAAPLGYGFPLNRPVTIVTASCTLLFHCINIHIDVTWNCGSIKRGSLEARFVKSLFKLDSTVRHWHFTRLKSKAQKGYIIPDLFRCDLCLCARLVFCHVFLIKDRRLPSDPTRHIFILIVRGLRSRDVSWRCAIKYFDFSISFSITRKDIILELDPSDLPLFARRKPGLINRRLTLRDKADTNGVTSRLTKRSRGKNPAATCQRHREARGLFVAYRNIFLKLNSLVNWEIKSFLKSKRSPGSGVIIPSDLISADALFDCYFCHFFPFCPGADGIEVTVDDLH